MITSISAISTWFFSLTGLQIFALVPIIIMSVVCLYFCVSILIDCFLESSREEVIFVLFMVWFVWGIAYLLGAF